MPLALQAESGKFTGVLSLKSFASAYKERCYAYIPIRARLETAFVGHDLADPACGVIHAQYHSGHLPTWTYTHNPMTRTNHVGTPQIIQGSARRLPNAAHWHIELDKLPLVNITSD